MVNGSGGESAVANKTGTKKAKTRSGPRSPAGKKPLLVVIDEDTIKKAKIAAIQDDKRVSGVVEELLKGWLASRKTTR